MINKCRSGHICMLRLKIIWALDHFLLSKSLFQHPMINSLFSGDFQSWFIIIRDTDWFSVTIAQTSTSTSRVLWLFLPTSLKVIRVFALDIYLGNLPFSYDAFYDCPPPLAPVWPSTTLIKARFNDAAIFAFLLRFPQDLHTRVTFELVEACSNLSKRVADHYYLY